MPGSKYAIITKKAFNKKKVNWVLYDMPLSEQDSGWQLFFGDETESYLDDMENSINLPLNEVLQFEPALATLFTLEEPADAYEYNPESGVFEEAEYDEDDDETEEDWQE